MVNNNVCDFKCLNKNTLQDYHISLVKACVIFSKA